MNKIKTIWHGLWNKLGLRTWADWRNVIHVITPVLVTLLASWVGSDVAQAVGMFVAAAISPALAFWNSTSTFRAWIYGLVVPLQGLLVALDVVTQEQYAGIAAIVLSLASAVLASSNTPTSLGHDQVANATVGEKITSAPGRHEAP